MSTPPTLAMNIKDESFFKDLGSRIALARKERNLTQVQLAAAMGIGQQALAHHEGGRPSLPASLLPVLPRELQLPVEDLLGQSSATKAHAKRRRAPALAQHIERSGASPKPQQKFVIQMIETALAQHGR